MYVSIPAEVPACVYSHICIRRHPFDYKQPKKSPKMVSDKRKGKQAKTRTRTTTKLSDAFICRISTMEIYLERVKVKTIF